MPKDILDAIDAKKAEIEAAKGNGAERLEVVSLVEELIQLKKDYRLVSGQEWKWTATQPVPHQPGRQPDAPSNSEKTAAALEQPKGDQKQKKQAAKQNQEKQKQKQTRQQHAKKSQQQQQQGRDKKAEKKKEKQTPPSFPTPSLPAPRPVATPVSVSLPAGAALPPSARFYIAAGMPVWVIDEETSRERQTETQTETGTGTGAGAGAGTGTGTERKRDGETPWRVNITKNSSGRYKVSITSSAPTVSAASTGWAGVVMGSPGEELGLWPVVPATSAANADHAAVRWVPTSQLRSRAHEERGIPISPPPGAAVSSARGETDNLGTAAVHEGVMCDVSGMCPIVGNRWKKKGQDYDLCDDEYLLWPPGIASLSVCARVSLCLSVSVSVCTRVFVCVLHNMYSPDGDQVPEARSRAAAALHQCTGQHQHGRLQRRRRDGERHRRGRHGRAGQNDALCEPRGV